MSNGYACCALGICCSPDSNEQREALAAALATDPEIDPVDAQKVAKWILKHFDLAPAGTLTDFKATIAKLARENSSKHRE